MAAEKPITENMREKANGLYRLLKANEGYLTKAQIGIVLGIKNERSVRDVISTLAKRVPIISRSDSEGYKLAQTQGDMEELIHAWKEIDSRIEELEARKKPMIKFYEKWGQSYE